MSDDLKANCLRKNYAEWQEQMYCYIAEAYSGNVQAIKGLLAMREELVSDVVRLRNALRGVMAGFGHKQAGWCHAAYWLANDWPAGETSCGKCGGCLAWQQAHDALAMVEREVIP